VLVLINLHDHKVSSSVVNKVRSPKVTLRVYYLVAGVEAKVIFKVVLGKGSLNLEFLRLDILGATELAKVIYKSHHKVTLRALTLYKVLIGGELMKFTALRFCGTIHSMVSAASFRTNLCRASNHTGNFALATRGGFNTVVPV
jgi:hypothetical protein